MKCVKCIPRGRRFGQLGEKVKADSTRRLEPLVESSIIMPTAIKPVVLFLCANDLDPLLMERMRTLQRRLDSRRCIIEASPDRGELYGNEHEGETEKAYATSAV